MHRDVRIVYSIVCLVLLGALAAPALAGPAPFTTTELIAGNNVPLVNGANLLAAVAAAGPNTLIKLEPGVYDLGGDQIVLPDFVDIEGSGRDITTIFSDLSIAATLAVIDVPAGVNGEVRELTVLARTTLAAATVVGVDIFSDDFLLTEVNVEIDTPSDAIGISTFKSSPRVDRSFVRILRASNLAVGVRIEDGDTVVTDSLVFIADTTITQAVGVDLKFGRPVLDDVILFSFFAKENFGIRAFDSNTVVTIRDTRVSAQGGSVSIGLDVGGKAEARVKESTFQAGSTSFAAGIVLKDAVATATESTFVADDLGFPHPDVFAAVLDGDSNLDSNQSNYRSTSFAVNNLGIGQARFGASQLIGNAVPAVFGPLVCAQSYNGAYAPVNNFCN